MAAKLPYGFKAWAERKSEKIRKDLRKSPSDPLLADELASKIGVGIFTLQELGLTSLQRSHLRNALYDFSAFTIKNYQGSNIIVHNEFHSVGRQQSNQMHEIAHIICEHPLPEPKRLDGFPFLLREYNYQHELEAETLGSVLQVTRKGLLKALKAGMNVDEMANYFHATKGMINFRISMTGVKRQIKNWSK